MTRSPRATSTLTPPEVWADRPDGSAPDTPGWRVRAVPNKYPALDQGYPEEMPTSGMKDPLGVTRGMPQLLERCAGRGNARGDRQLSARGAVAGRA